jgi:hypothetical protein
MSADDEIRLYLQSLLEHQADCESEHCPWCLALQGVLDSVRCKIFSGPVFPEVTIANPPPPAQKKRKAPQESVPYAKLPVPNSPIQRNRSDP